MIVQTGFPDPHHLRVAGQLLDPPVPFRPYLPGIMGMDAYCGKNALVPVRQGHGSLDRGERLAHAHGNHSAEACIPCPLDHLIPVGIECLRIQMGMGINEDRPGTCHPAFAM